MTAPTTLYLRPADKALLRRLADLGSLSMSEVVRRLLHAEAHRCAEEGREAPLSPSPET